MTASVRVLCIDDNRLLAEALQTRLALEPQIEWAGWVHEAAEARRVARESRPHVILLDIDMPGCDSFALARELTDGSPDVRVVMFSGHVRADYVDRAVDAGAWGYVSKNESMDDVLEAIRRVAAGEFVLTPDVNGEYWRK